MSNSVKYILKRSLQHIAAIFGRHMRSGNNPQLLVLMYHRILPVMDSRALSEEPGMLVTPETFRMHLGILKQHFEIVHLSEWLDLKNSNAKLPARSCVITFDDGWADNYEFAFPVLCEYQVPATIFLVSDMIGTDKQFWPERLAQIINTIALNHSSQWTHPALDWIKKPTSGYQFTTAPPTQEELSELIANAKRLADQEIHTRLDTIEKELNLSLENSTPPLLNWEQLREMSNSGLVEAGSHTRNHIRLNEETTLETLSREIIGSKKKIEEKTGLEAKTFCFPNGDYSMRALEMVREYYAGAVSTIPGWNSATSDNHLLHRIGIHEDITKDRTAFLARISGFF